MVYTTSKNIYGHILHCQCYHQCLSAQAVSKWISELYNNTALGFWIDGVITLWTAVYSTYTLPLCYLCVGSRPIITFYALKLN